jgi:hypothetical protein
MQGVEQLLGAAQLPWERMEPRQVDAVLGLLARPVCALLSRDPSARPCMTAFAQACAEALATCTVSDATSVAPSLPTAGKGVPLRTGSSLPTASAHAQAVAATPPTASVPAQTVAATAPAARKGTSGAGRAVGAGSKGGSPLRWGAGPITKYSAPP